ncbi:MAG: hypothetical protein R2714_12975 [Microthrixaceae bacterium]|nr:hypothetical protein [Microthrixaceae bacterium]
MRPPVVVFVDEVVDEFLECGDGSWSGVGVEPFLHGLVETLDLAAGGGVVRPGVFLFDPE